MPQAIYKNGCWGCKKAQEAYPEKYVCPKLSQHWAEYEKQQSKYW